MNAIPIFEAKNKLPLFIHQAETGEPVFISRRNKNVAVLISLEKYNALLAKSRKPTILEKAERFRKQTEGLLTDEQIDEIFSATKDTTVDPYTTNVFDGVFDD